MKDKNWLLSKKVYLIRDRLELPSTKPIINFLNTYCKHKLDEDYIEMGKLTIGRDIVNWDSWFKYWEELWANRWKKDFCFLRDNMNLILDDKKIEDLTYILREAYKRKENETLSK